MKGLLDTHTFLWWITNDIQLSQRVRSFISDEKNEIFVSAASGWEIAIKAQIGKLPLPDTPARFVTKHISLNGFHVLPIRFSHTLHVYTLPMHHRDPFDRILIAQSQIENWPILTRDSKITQYSVRVIW